MKLVLKRYLPSALLSAYRFSVRFLDLLAGADYDLRRFLRHSRSLGERDRLKLRASIIAHYHVVEKGLAMPLRKRVFGLSIVKSLVEQLLLWHRRGYGDDRQIIAARDSLIAYSTAVGPDPVALIPGLKDYLGGVTPKKIPLGGVTTMGRRMTLGLGRGDFADLVRARKSIRNYSNQEVAEDTLVQAVALAQNSPSVCNRQTSNVFWTTRRSTIDEMLVLQNGNRGFGNLAQALLIVPGELSVFEGGGERSQVRIDAGMFSMSLLYALSYLGLGACALNWSVKPERDRALRKLAAIPDHQEVIMMIAVGHLKEDFSVAISQRHETEEVMWSLDGAIQKPEDSQ
jgi:nitroreductase